MALHVLVTGAGGLIGHHLVKGWHDEDTLGERGSRVQRS